MRSSLRGGSGAERSPRCSLLQGRYGASERTSPQKPAGMCRRAGRHAAVRSELSVLIKSDVAQRVSSVGASCQCLCVCSRRENATAGSVFRWRREVRNVFHCCLHHKFTSFIVKLRGLVLLSSPDQPVVLFHRLRSQTSPDAPI